MATELLFYTNPLSRGRIVRWMREEPGIADHTELLGLDSGMKAAVYMAIHPMGKIPAIVHRNQVRTKTAAICAYLAAAFPDAGLVPLIFQFECTGNSASNQRKGALDQI